jgi:hypothetical protein
MSAVLNVPEKHRCAAILPTPNYIPRNIPVSSREPMINPRTRGQCQITIIEQPNARQARCRSNRNRSLFLPPFWHKYEVALEI